MADDGRSAEWDEVGRLFGELGHRLQNAWSANKPEKAGDEAEEGARNVGAVFEELKTSITKTVADPDVRQAAGRASSSLTDALATSLRQLADWVEHKPGSAAGGGGSSSSSSETVDEAARVTQTDPPAEG